VNPYVANFGLLVFGVGILYIGAEWLVRGSSRLATSMGISPVVVGLTVVSFGTSAPELVVALIAALDGNPDLAMGNVMGSNLANVGLILGLTAMIRPMDVASRVVRREIPIMLLLTLLLFPIVANGRISAFEGGVLFALLVAYLAFVNRSRSDAVPDEVAQTFQSFAEAQRQFAPHIAGLDFVFVISGSLGLVLGGTAIVRSAEFLAASFGIPDVVVGLTVVAVGTSLPELATAVVAALRGESDLAVGNIVGSNIFNIAAILGITSMITPIDVSITVITRELPAVLLISLLVLPLTRTGFRVRRWEGVVLLASYFLLTTWLVAF
jgi:cation:H+ antiporter